MKSIRAQLQLNYIAVAALALLLVLAVMWINSADRSAEEEFFSVDLEQIGEDYLYGGLEYAFEDPAFTRDDAIELLDSNYTVMDTVNSRTPVGYTYSQQEFNEMISLSEEDTYFTWYPENGDGSFLLIRLAPLEDYYDTLILFSVIATLLFIALVYLFARHTGKRIIGPIKKLTEGANALENGDLDYRIHFEGNNELVSLRDAFNSMAQKLAEETKKREHIEENRKVLIRNISHDIKTPLTNIIGYAQTLTSPKKQSGEDVSNAYQVILKNGITANALVGELFELSKLDLDTYAMDLHETDIVELFRLKIIDYIPEFELRQIDYTIDIPEKRIGMPVNAVQFNRALDNLIQNSIKYNVEKFAIVFRLAEERDDILITISDNGIGIPPEYTDRIFEPTIRVDDSRHTEGSGLGLAITKKIVEAHNGEISLDAAYKNGCRFIICLPKRFGPAVSNGTEQAR